MVPGDTMRQQRSGRSYSLTHGRRFVADVTHFSQGIPFIVVERHMHIADVVHARRLCDPRPGWLAIFVKAFGIAALAVPDLRRSWLSFPWQRLYEHPTTTVGITMVREWQGEPTVFILPIRRPEELPLTDIANRIHKAMTADVAEIGAFRRLILVGRWPKLVRRLIWWLGLRVTGSWRQKYFGTVTINNTGNAGADVLFAVTPVTSYLTFGQVTDEGQVAVRLIFDHRVYDAMPAGQGLVAMEAAINGPILQELQALSRTT
jgi:hypothetical protein